MRASVTTAVVATASCLALLVVSGGQAQADELDRLYLLTTGSHEDTLDAELSRFTGRVLDSELDFEFAGDQSMETIYADCAQDVGANAATQRECRLRAANRVMVSEVLEVGARRLARGRYELTLEVWSPESNGQRFASVLEHEADSLDVAARESLSRLAERYLCYRGDDVACAAARSPIVSTRPAKPASQGEHHVTPAVFAPPSTEGGGVMIDASGTRSFAEVLRDRERRCQEDDEAQACYAMAHAHVRGELGLDSRADLAVPWLERGCALSHAESCYVLADGYHNGTVLTRDTALWVGYLELACDAGYQQGCDELGPALVERTAGLDPYAAPEVTAMLTRACEMRTAEACTRLGASGLDKSEPAAWQLLERACELGDGAGCLTLGVAMRDGVGGAMDLDRAFETLTRGCEELDNINACVGLGTMVENRQGPKRTLDVAIEVYEGSCEQGHAEGCWRLGNTRHRMASTSERSRPWLEKAGRAWDKACDLGQVDACRSLGELYTEDIVDLDAARVPFRRACARGDDLSCESLEDLAVAIRRERYRRR